MSVITLATGLAQAGLSIVKNQQAKNDIRNLKNYQNQLKREAFQYLDNLTNKFANYQVSDRGEKLALERSGQSVSTAAQAYSEGGAATLGNMSNLVRASDQTALDVGAQLSEKEEKAQLIRMKGEDELQKLKEGGKYDFTLGELEGSQERLAELRTQQSDLQGNIIEGLGTAGEAALDMTKLYNKHKSGGEKSTTDDDDTTSTGGGKDKDDEMAGESIYKKGFGSLTKDPNKYPYLYGNSFKQGFFGES